MSRGIVPNFEYIGSHIKEYIQNNNLFDIFDIEDIKTIMKHSQFTASDFENHYRSRSVLNHKTNSTSLSCK